MSRQPFGELERRAREIADLRRTNQLILWDQRVMMPVRGGARRGSMSATVAKAEHERWTDPGLGTLLEDLRGFGDSRPYESYEASLVRVMRRDRDRQVHVPAELSEERIRLSGEAYAAWVEARRTSDFSRFHPFVARQVSLARRYAECFDVDESYDALLGSYEPGLTTAEVRTVFKQLKDGLMPLIAEISGRQTDDSFMKTEFALEGQQEIDAIVLGRFGFRDDQWRHDATVHPFASALATSDIRLTTRYLPGVLSLFVSMHEGGHGMYEHNVDPRFERTPLCNGASSAFHESQSRGYENLVGRSLPFWRWCFPHLQRALPDPFASVELAAFHAAINRVKPSLIRVEADEATYGLHIILRFELEQDLIAGTVDAADLPEIWNQRMGEYLGVEVPDDAHGVLQDVHWSGGNIGHFSTYALGNIIAAQLWERMRVDNPHLDDQLENGDLAPLADWLCEHVWRHGRVFTPRELLDRTVGGGLDPEALLRYLRTKHNVA